VGFDPIAAVIAEASIRSPLEELVRRASDLSSRE
jgi:hypothetical protein